MANITNIAQKAMHNVVGSPSEPATRTNSSDADLFLKRSAAYYHAQTPSSLDSVSSLRAQRDPMLAHTLQSLAPSDTNFSPTLMHSRLQAAQNNLARATQKINSKKLLASVQSLQKQIEAGLALQQEATDNQRLLIRA